MPTESLYGYLVRLSETNGYSLPSAVLSYAGYADIRKFSFSTDTKALSDVVGASAELFQRIAYSPMPGVKKQTKLLSHPLGSAHTLPMLSLMRSAVCPRCVDENGFVDAFWDLTVAIVCPIHRCRAITACNYCLRRVSWMRPGLLTCKCDKPLTENCSGNISKALIGLMQIIHDKVYGRDSALHPGGQGFPIREINGLSLRELLTIVLVIGRFDQRIGRSEIRFHIESVVESAAVALSDWPRGFYRFLNRLGMHYRAEGRKASALRKQFKPFYKVIYRSSSLTPAANFLRIAFIDFGHTQWRHSVLDKRQIHKPSSASPTRFHSLSTAATLFNVSPVTLKKWCRSGLVPHESISVENRTRIIIDTKDVGNLMCLPGKTMNARDAAATANLPVSVLKQLRQSGHFRCNHNAEYKHGFHENDVADISDRLLRASKELDDVEIDSSSHISMSEVLRIKKFWSKQAKAQFVADYLDGKVVSVGRTGSRLDSIYFQRIIVDKYIDKAREKNVGGKMTLSGVAEALDCSPDCVQDLMRQGLLSAKDGPYYRRACELSVERFASKYVSLSELSKPLGTSVKRLNRLADDHQIMLVVTRSTRGVTTPFIAREDSNQLIQIYRKLLAEKSRIRSENSGRVSHADLMRTYLDSLRDSNSPLPRRGNRPNLVEIAQASGFSRNTFYANKTVKGLLDAYAIEDAERNKIDERSETEKLRIFLAETRMAGQTIPLRKCGLPHKSRIAELAGIDRNLFYQSPLPNRLVSEYLLRERT